MPAPFTRVDYIAQQLRAAAPDAEWIMAGHDRAQELARILDRNGILNLGLLFLVSVRVSQQWHAFEAPYVFEGFALQYQGRNYGFLGTPDRADSTPILENDLQLGYKIAWSAVGHGNVSYIVKRSPIAGLQIVPVWASSSDLDDIRQFALTAASLALSVVMPAAGINIGVSLGASIVGPTFAAAYPGVTAALGNIAISTAMNGGDVGAAVAGAALAYGSGLVGNTARAYTGSVLAGRVAATATSALVSGRDVEGAIAQTVITYGIQGGAMSLFDWIGNWGDAPASGGGDFTFNPDGSYTPPIGYIDPITGNPLNPSIFDNPDWGDWWENPNFGWDFGFNFDPLVTYQPGTLQPSLPPAWTPTGANPPPSPALPAPSPASAPSPVAAPSAPPGTFNPVALVQTVTQTAMAALALVRAYRDAMNPRPVTQARTVSANGSVTATTSNGMIQTRGPSGGVTTQLPPPGVPHATVDGNLIVNNGDGTYTVIYPDGRTEIRRYPPGAGGESLGIEFNTANLPAVGLIAAGAALIFIARRR